MYIAVLSMLFFLSSIAFIQVQSYVNLFLFAILFVVLNSWFKNYNFFSFLQKHTEWVINFTTFCQIKYYHCLFLRRIIKATKVWLRVFKKIFKKNQAYSRLWSFLLDKKKWKKRRQMMKKLTDNLTRLFQLARESYKAGFDDNSTYNMHVQL